MIRRLALPALVLLSACAAPEPEAPAPQRQWAIAIHGGAGVIARDQFEGRREEYERALAAALDLGIAILEQGGTSLDAVETVIASMEDDPLFNAGRGAVLNARGQVELDASIMDGRDRSCGAVTGSTTVKNPIKLARKVMEQTRHVLLAADGAESFADETGVERREPDWFITDRRRESLERWLEQQEQADSRGTVGCVALDRHGDLAAGTSTGGLTGKLYGRVGDSPIVGAGTYADNTTCAVSGTGTGEEYIRNYVAGRMSALMQYAGWNVGDAARHMMDEVLDPGSGGLIAVDHLGRIVMLFNTNGMFRGAADSDGLRTIAIWED